MTFDVFGRLPDSGRAETKRKLVQFSVGALLCSVDIMKVREIVNPGTIVPVPSPSPALLGATDHRETVVPVVDLRSRLNLPPTVSPKAKWVIADAGGLDLALLVDEVHGVKTVSGSMERERHPLVDGTDASWVSHVFGTPDGLLFELDLDAMFEIVESDPSAVPESGEFT